MQNRFIIGLALVCLLRLCGSSVVAAEATAPSLVANGDFEAQPPTKGGLPPGWIKPFGAVQRLEIVPETRPGSPGKQCLKIGTDQTIKMSGAYSELMPFDAKRGLYVAGWVRPGDSERQLRGLYFGVGWYDKDKTPIIVVKNTTVNYVYLHHREVHGPWYRMEIVLSPADAKNEQSRHEIPPNAAFFDIRVFALNYPAPGWFDDIEARQLEPGELKRIQAALAPKKPTGRGQALPLAPVKIDNDWVVGWVGERKAAEAAAEMQKFLSQVVGQKVVATPWQPNKAKHVFVITDARHAPKNVAEKLDGTRRDAFVIEYPVRWDGQDVCLLVAHDELSYDYPVYYFLTRFMDVHWVGPGDLGVVLREQPEWTFPERISLVENPDFEMRHWYSISFRCRQWLAAGVRMQFHHALGHVFHPRKHADTSDVYPLVGGARYVPKFEGKRHTLAGWQPCTGNPKSVQIAVEHVLKTFEDKPSTATVSLSVNDGAGNICECDLCRAQDAKDAFQEGQRPNLSDRFFRFYNTVIERACGTNPNARVAVLGYGAVKTPPMEVKVDPRISVFHVQPSVAELRAWRDAGANPNLYMWLWDGGFLTVRPNPQVVVDLVRAAHEMGGIGFYSEVIPHWIIGAPKFYLIAHVLWDTQRDADQLLDEYFHLAYGKHAAPHARAFFDRWYSIYDRLPADEGYRTAWGWRGPEQMQYVLRDDLAAMDVAMEKAKATTLTPKEKQRLEYLDTFYQIMRVNADQYLTGKEMADPNWLSSHGPDEILDHGERTHDLTAKFDRLWQEHVAGDNTGWFLDGKHQKDPQAFWDQFDGALRAMVASAHETAIDNAIGYISEKLLEREPKDKVVAFWQAQLKQRPVLEGNIGPQINVLKGIAPQEVVPNGGFEEGSPGSPPEIDGWEFYEKYGMVKGIQANYAWEPGSGHDGGRAIAFGEGRYPEMKGIIRLEKGHRYDLSFWYKTSAGRERNCSFWIFNYDEPITTASDIEKDKIHTLLRINLEPTDGHWRQVTRRLTATHDGTHIIMLVSYYQTKGNWTWWDDIRIRKIW